jgi:hypothetical protein
MRNLKNYQVDILPVSETKTINGGWSLPEWLEPLRDYLGKHGFY